MNFWRPTFLALLAALAVAVSACGGDSGVPEGAVAVVDGTVIERKDLDTLVERARKNTEAQNQEFPKVGTPEFQNIQRQYLAYLVQQAQFEHEADELGIELTDKDLDKEVDKFVESRFEGKRAEFEQALKEQGYTPESFRDTLRISVLSQKILDSVTKDVTVPEADIVQYYQQNSAVYQQVNFPRSEREAARLYAQLRGGADFATLAKQHSDDEGTKADGGKLTITKGQTVPQFEKTAFALGVGEMSEPVKTSFGYHIIEALGPVRGNSRDVRHILVAEKTGTPLAKVRASIKATLLQQKKTEVLTEWTEDIRDKYDGKTSYALGFEPPELPEPTETETDTAPTE